MHWAGCVFLRKTRRVRSLAFVFEVLVRRTARLNAGQWFGTTIQRIEFTAQDRQRATVTQRGSAS